MAQSSINAVALVLAAVAILAVTASAQDSSIAPTPTQDTGAGFSLPVSTALIAGSLLFSVFALFRH